MKILVTAFEAFGGSARNSSLDTLISLPDSLGENEIVKLTLPVEYLRCGELLRKSVDDCGASAVLCLGQAEGRGTVTPEYCALNLMHSASADNAGQTMKLTEISPDGNGALFCKNAVLMTDYLVSRGYPVTLSLSAGTYVCNSLMYAALELGCEKHIPAYFIHLPLSFEIAYAEKKIGRALTLPQRLLTDTVYSAIEFIIGGLS